MGDPRFAVLSCSPFNFGIYGSPGTAMAIAELALALADAGLHISTGLLPRSIVVQPPFDEAALRESVCQQLRLFDVQVIEEEQWDWPGP